MICCGEERAGACCPECGKKLVCDERTEMIADFTKRIKQHETAMANAVGKKAECFFEHERSLIEKYKQWRTWLYSVAAPVATGEGEECKKEARP